MIQEITLPFNLNYVNVINLVSIITYSIFYFYLFWLAGSSLYSYYLRFIKRDDASSFLARNIITLPLKKITYPIVLGVIPTFVILSLDFILLTGNEFSSLHTLTQIFMIIFIAAIISLSTYKNTFVILQIVPNNVVEKNSPDYLEFLEVTLKRHRRAALIGVILILLALFLFSILGISKLDYEKENFDFDFLAYLISLKVLWRVLIFIILSLSIVFITSLFFLLIWDETKLIGFEGLNEFIEKKLIKGLQTTLILLPAIFFVDLLIFPKNSLSYTLFLTTGLIVVLVFLILNLINAYRKEYYPLYLKYSFLSFLLIFLAFSVREVIATENILKPKIVEIDKNFIAYEEKLKSKLNIKTVTINAEDIFQAKCVACHRFDSKLVGPPYNLVLKKYENNKELLTKFILNPVKVDPAYPPMPAQGLTPPEAEAVAEYLLKTYQENIKRE